MAVRLQMKLGVVAEHDRLPDSPDTLVVVEPSVGSVARSKGLLYLLVTSRISSRHALEATRLAAETIRNEYYYDESAGIRVCIQKAIATANKRLAHQADRLGLKSPDGNGPIGVGAGGRPRQRDVRRDGRAGRGLPHPPGPPLDAARPAPRARPAVRRARAGRLARRDLGRRLARPGLARTSSRKLGPDELKDAMLTLHPQSAMEHLHHRFVAADGAGSDGAIAFEATEVSATAPRTLAGPGQARRAARRRPGPLADPARRQRPGGGAAGQRRGRAARRSRPAAPSSGVVAPAPGPHAAAQAGLSAGHAARLAARDPAPGRARAPRPRRGRRRARPGRVRVRRDRHRSRPSARSTPARRRSTRPRANLAKVTAPGIDLVADDPSQATSS